MCNILVTQIIVSFDSNEIMYKTTNFDTWKLIKKRSVKNYDSVMTKLCNVNDLKIRNRRPVWYYGQYWLHYLGWDDGWRCSGGKVFPKVHKV